MLYCNVLPETTVFCLFVVSLPLMSPEHFFVFHVTVVKPAVLTQTGNHTADAQKRTEVDLFPITRASKDPRTSSLLLIAVNLFFSSDTGLSMLSSYSHYSPIVSSCFHEFFLFLPIAKSCLNNHSKKFSLLSQLALSSQNKFFLKSPPKSRKKRAAAAADQAAGAPEADVVSQLGSEADTNDFCLSPGLDSAICDLVSLDSQAEVDQGIFVFGGTSALIWSLLGFSCAFVHAVPIKQPFLVFFGGGVRGLRLTVEN